MAEQLIESMTERWNPKDFRDTYTDRVKKLVAAKKKGKEVTVAAEPPEATNVIDLMAVLKASVDAAKGGRHMAKRAARPAKKATAARKATARKGTAARKASPAKKAAAAQKTNRAKKARRSA
jgi:DNA end-binding protein Ku